MSAAIQGCEAHAALVERALGPDATDADLERYATEVVDCPACKRLLAVGAGVHPAHLERAAVGEHEAIEARMAMDDAALERLDAALQPGPRWPFVLVALAAAALLFVLARPLVAPAPTVAPVVASSIQAVQTGPTVLPQRSEALPEAVQDAVAMIEPPEQVEPDLDDWDAPPFEELRARVAKQAAVREARLQLDGEPTAGGSVRLAVSTASAEVVTVCVTGPEKGVVWRGGVPQGRTVLTRDGKAVRYAFGAPGTYRFGLSLGDGCGAPVHTLEVSL